MPERISIADISGVGYENQNGYGTCCGLASGSVIYTIPLALKMIYLLDGRDGLLMELQTRLLLGMDFG